VHLAFSAWLMHNAGESATSCASTLWLNKSRWLFAQLAGLSLCLRAFKDARMVLFFTNENKHNLVKTKGLAILFRLFLHSLFHGFLKAPVI
jgi:hypothetical protein